MPLRLAHSARLGKLVGCDRLAAVGERLTVQLQRGGFLGQAPLILDRGPPRLAHLHQLGLDSDDLGLGDRGDADEGLCIPGPRHQPRTRILRLCAGQRGGCYCLGTPCVDIVAESPRCRHRCCQLGQPLGEIGCRQLQLERNEPRAQLLLRFLHRAQRGDRLAVA